MRKFLRLAGTIFSWRRCAAAILFLASSAVLITGMVRLSLYDVPMLTGDYETASNQAVLFPHAPKDDKPQPFEHKESFDEKLMIKLVDGWAAYTDWACGNRAKPRFNLAMERFEDGQYGQARTAFQRAIADAAELGGGAIRPEYKGLVSNINVYVGLTYEHENKDKEAYPCYEAALSADLNPNNKVAKYNLERMQDSQSGGSGDQPSKANDPKPKGGKPNGKI